MSDTLNSNLADLLRQLPDWLRHDLSSADPARRERAEDALHARLLLLIRNQSEATGQTD